MANFDYTFANMSVLNSLTPDPDGTGPLFGSATVGIAQLNAPFQLQFTGETITAGQSGTLTPGFLGPLNVTFVGTSEFGDPIFEIVGGGGTQFVVSDAPLNPGDIFDFGAQATTPACFLPGTLIATPDGERTVETLAIGDLILTSDGRTVRVKWMGRQHIRNHRFLSAKLQPVVIAAGALGQGLPHTDLFLSADHGLIWQGLVVNAGAMVNGSTIRFVPLAEMPAEFTYFHIETEGHEEILANGAPAETFVDYVGRSVFDNHQEYLDLYGAERIIPEMKRSRISAQRMLPNHLRALLDIAPYGVEIEAEHEVLMQRLNAA